MNKFKNRSGFTLIEMLVTLVILVCLVIGIGVGMDAGSRVYKDAIFEADSANLAGILNTAIGDILRYSIDVCPNPRPVKDPETSAVDTEMLMDSTGSYVDPSVVPFVFTSLDYGIQNAYFVTNATTGVLQMKNLMNEEIVELVNTGAYPDLMIKDFKVVPAEKKDETGIFINCDYFTVTYKIFSVSDNQKTRNVEYIVRNMNN